jgi:hypothetical protein
MSLADVKAERTQRLLLPMTRQATKLRLHRHLDWPGARSGHAASLLARQTSPLGTVCGPGTRRLDSEPPLSAEAADAEVRSQIAAFAVASAGSAAAGTIDDRLLRASQVLAVHEWQVASKQHYCTRADASCKLYPCEVAAMWAVHSTWTSLMNIFATLALRHIGSG